MQHWRPVQRLLQLIITSRYAICNWYNRKNWIIDFRNYFIKFKYDKKGIPYFAKPLIFRNNIF